MNKTQTVLNVNNKNITIIGTAHVSKLSAIEVKETIDELHPDTICIELDKQRYESINHPKKWEDTDIIDVIKQKKTGYLLANLILASYQKKMASKMDSTSGGEMMQAIKSSKELDIHLEMIDRDVQTTFTRIYRKHSFFQKISLFTSLIGSIFDDEEITDEDIEKLKQGDALDAAINDVQKSFPVVAEVLIDERNKILAQNIRKAPGDNIVAIVGAAHVPGILEYINEDIDIDELNTVPPKSTFSKVIGWAIPIALILMILSMFRQSPTQGFDQLINWCLWNGSLSAIGTLIAGGSIFAILTAFIAAPITSLNPLLAAGWFAGIVEAYVKKPKVKDLSTLSEAGNSLKSLYKNRFTHILIVVILANLFSTIGTFIGGFDVVVNFISTLF